MKMLSKHAVLSVACALLLSVPAFAGSDTPPDGVSEASAESFAKRGKGKKKRAKTNAFKAMDTDNDGKISKTEARGKIATNFDTIDADSDGFITRAEMQAACAAKKANNP